VLGRIVIDDIRHLTPSGYPAKALAGEQVRITAAIYRDGHDILAARVRLGDEVAAMAELGNDEWEALVHPETLGAHRYVVEAWTDHRATWAHKVKAKQSAGQDVDVELAEGRARFRSIELDGVHTEATEADDLTKVEMPLWVDRERALVGAWYELFPRSEGGLAATAKRVPAVAAMGFDVLYLPPIHPIGRTGRKGANNTLNAGVDDPGSPWAIGSPEGGHTAIDPGLGTEEDFSLLVDTLAGHGMEVALDYALQCSPDHPWVTGHPEWFHRRPDGSIAFAENPPKKYQDIFPVNLWPKRRKDRLALWDACKAIVDFWLARGVRIFRVDNPHTKPFAFWEWLIPAVQAEHPDVIFLAEAFTRPKSMAKLAEVGFSQSYTYFTWRTQQHGEEGLWAYLEELAHGPKADYMRPNFWPNTPDILSGPLRKGTPAAFASRLILAATMSPSYGVYRGYEYLENEPASDSNEEYLHSEKYEIRARPWDPPAPLVPLITRLNEIRRAHPAMRWLRNVHLHPTDNPAVIAYSKSTGDDVLLMVVNLDPLGPEAATLDLDLGALGLAADQPYVAEDLLTGDVYSWSGAKPWVWLDAPAGRVAHILAIRGGDGP
jgi:starch synthase (maltosyl-transferring)